MAAKPHLAAFNPDLFSRLETSISDDLKRSGLNPDDLGAIPVPTQPVPNKNGKGKRPIWFYPIPYPKIGGGMSGFYRYRHLEGEWDGKYFQGAKGKHLYIPPTLADDPRLLDTKETIAICEGEKKALAMAKAGHVAVAVGGTGMATNGALLIKELAELIPGDSGRKVVIDFDREPNPETERQLAMLATTLFMRGAEPFQYNRPAEHKGLDDELVANGPDLDKYELIPLGDALREIQNRYILHEGMGVFDRALNKHIPEHLAKDAYQRRSTLGPRGARRNPYDDWVNFSGRLQVREIICDPSQAPDSFPDPFTYNNYRLPNVVAREGPEAKYFLDFLFERLGEQANFLLDCFAHVRQNPGKRISLFVYLSSMGATGVGKSTALFVLGRAAVGVDKVRKVKDVEIPLPYTEYFDPYFGVTIYDDLKINMAKARAELQDPIEDGLVTINDKFGKKYDAKTFTFFCGAGNDNLGWLSVTVKEDRRDQILMWPDRPIPDEYLSRVEAWKVNTKDNPLLTSLAYFLDQRDISGFNPNARAELSDTAKSTIQGLTREQDEELLLQFIESHPDREIFTADELREETCDREFPNYSSPHRVARIVKENYPDSFSPKERLNRSKRLWVVRNCEYWSKVKGIKNFKKGLPQRDGF